MINKARYISMYVTWKRQHSLVPYTVCVASGRDIVQLGLILRSLYVMTRSILYCLKTCSAFGAVIGWESIPNRA